MNQRYTFKRREEGESLKPGQWQPFHESVLCCCPGCSQSARLHHDIDESGVVTPSLDCPTEHCGFHRMVELEGWGDEPA